MFAKQVPKKPIDNPCVIRKNVKQAIYENNLPLPIYCNPLYPII